MCSMAASFWNATASAASFAAARHSISTARPSTASKTSARPPRASSGSARPRFSKLLHHDLSEDIGTWLKKRRSLSNSRTSSRALRTDRSFSRASLLTFTKMSSSPCSAHRAAARRRFCAFSAAFCSRARARCSSTVRTSSASRPTSARSTPSSRSTLSSPTWTFTTTSPSA